MIHYSYLSHKGINKPIKVNECLRLKKFYITLIHEVNKKSNNSLRKHIQQLMNEMRGMDLYDKIENVLLNKLNDE